MAIPLLIILALALTFHLPSANAMETSIVAMRAIQPCDTHHWPVTNNDGDDIFGIFKSETSHFGHATCTRPYNEGMNEYNPSPPQTEPSEQGSKPRIPFSVGPDAFGWTYQNSTLFYNMFTHLELCKRLPPKYILLPTNDLPDGIGGGNCICDMWGYRDARFEVCNCDQCAPMQGFQLQDWCKAVVDRAFYKISGNGIAYVKFRQVNGHLGTFLRMSQGVGDGVYGGGGREESGRDVDMPLFGTCSKRGGELVEVWKIEEEERRKKEEEGKFCQFC